jgi:lipopolysaccharide biosynthesis protein
VSHTDSFVRLIAFYFPQFHAIPENDEWWGAGFTDWNNVRTAVPILEDHYQPRVPLGARYYDLSRKEAVRWQVELAKQYGVGGFCHYHYWFDGKHLLGRPTEIVLESPELDLPFCLCWANETWSRRWDGQDHHILQLQTHRPDRALWQAHFDYLLRVWSDPRALTIGGKPVFFIYRPHRVHQLGEMFDYWREQAHRHGLPGLFLGAMKQHEFENPALLRYFDAVIKFQPFEAMFARDGKRVHARGSRLFELLRLLPEPAKALLRIPYRKIVPTRTFSYDSAWEQILVSRDEPAIINFEGAFVDWDNTARYKHRAMVFRGASPERFGYWLEQLVAKVAVKPATERLIFLNAWNEWSESAYLEPDERFGFGYLEKVRDLFGGARG